MTLNINKIGAVNDLINAINDDQNIQTVKHLLAIGANPYGPIEDDSAFDLAASKNNLQILTLIQDKVPASREQLNKALRITAIFQHIEASKLLLEWGANPHHRPFIELGSVCNPLDIARFKRNDKLLKMLMETGYTPSFELGDGVDEMRHLARVWGIKKEWKGFSSEDNSFKNLAHARIAQSLKAYVSQNADHRIPDPEKIIQAFDNADELQDCQTQLANIQNGELTVISTGCKGHAIDLVFDKTRLAICQRVESKTEIFKIDPTKLTKTLLTEIYEMREKPCEEADEFFYDTLRVALDGRCLTVFSSYLEQTEQKGGFCTWNSPEAALFTTIALQYLSKAKTVEDIPGLIKEAKQVYKDSTTFFRLFFTNEYIDKILEREFDWDEFTETTNANGHTIRIPPPDIIRYKYLDYDLLKIIRARLESDWHPERFHSDYLKALKAKTLKRLRIALLPRASSCVMF